MEVQFIGKTAAVEITARTSLYQVNALEKQAKVLQHSSAVHRKIQQKMQQCIEDYDESTTMNNALPNDLVQSKDFCSSLIRTASN